MDRERGPRLEKEYLAEHPSRLVYGAADGLSEAELDAMTIEHHLRTLATLYSPIRAVEATRCIALIREVLRKVLVPLPGYTNNLTAKAFAGE